MIMPVMRPPGLVNSTPPSPAWAPTDGANLGLWLDASDTNTITAVGNDASQIDDKSSNNLDFIVGNNAQTGTRTINGLNVIDCVAASSHYIQNTAYIPQGSFQIAAVFRPDTVTASDEPLFRIGGTVRVLLRPASSTEFLSELQMFGTGNVTGPPVTANIEGVTSLQRVSFDLGGDWEQFVDGTSAHSETGGYTTQFNAERFNIMSAHSVVGYLDGAFCELVVFENVTSSIGQQVEGYLAHKWGLEANLPGGHPYKSAPPTV